MHTVGSLVGIGRTYDGEMTVTFAIDEVPGEDIQFIKDKELNIDAEPYKSKRSLNANAYFWQLCSKIAKALNTDKDTIYLMMLVRYGVFEHIEVIKQGIPVLRAACRHIEVVDEYEIDSGEQVLEMAAVNCYLGSHLYDTKQMSDLINGAVSEATALGIPTLTDKELSRMCSAWRTQ